MAPLFGVVTSQNHSWAFAFLITQGEVTTMTYTLEIDTAVEKLIEELRMKHIDANLIIQEELSQLLPSFIEDIVRGIYEEAVR